MLLNMEKSESMAANKGHETCITDDSLLEVGHYIQNYCNIVFCSTDNSFSAFLIVYIRGKNTPKHQNN